LIFNETFNTDRLYRAYDDDDDCLATNKPLNDIKMQQNAKKTSKHSLTWS